MYFKLIFFFFLFLSSPHLSNMLLYSLPLSYQDKAEQLFKGKGVMKVKKKKKVIC